MTLRAAMRGFTLIELMVAIAIAALLVILAAPSFITFLRNSEIRSTSESIINGLRAAAAEAANRNKQVTFELTTNATSADWRFWVANDNGTENTLQTYNKNEAGKNSKLTVEPAGKRTVTFNGLGRVEIDPADRDNHIQYITIESVVPGEARSLRIIVDDKTPPAAGRPRGLRLCDPDTTLPADDPRRC